MYNFPVNAFGIYDYCYTLNQVLYSWAFKYLFSLYYPLAVGNFIMSFSDNFSNPPRFNVL